MKHCSCGRPLPDVQTDNQLRMNFRPERLGEAVHVALSTAKPKARYAVVRDVSRTGRCPDFFL